MYSFHFLWYLQSGERNGTPSRRSKSEGPPMANGRCVKLMDNVTQIKEKVYFSSLYFNPIILLLHNFNIITVSIPVHSLKLEPLQNFIFISYLSLVLAWWYRACVVRAYNLNRLWFWSCRIRAFTFHSLSSWCSVYEHYTLLHRSTRSFHLISHEKLPTLTPHTLSIFFCSACHIYTSFMRWRWHVWVYRME